MKNLYKIKITYSTWRHCYKMQLLEQWFTFNFIWKFKVYTLRFEQAGSIIRVSKMVLACQDAYDIPDNMIFDYTKQKYGK